MALENPITKIVITKFTCAYCNQSRYKNGFFRIFKDIGMQFFCSKKCSDYAKKNTRRIICKTCGKSFINVSSAQNRKYCSRPCGRKDQPDRYKVFNWCGMCNEWIRKTESIIQPAGTATVNGYKTKQDNHFCPICKNRLRLGSKYSSKKKNKEKGDTVGY